MDRFFIALRFGLFLSSFLLVSQNACNRQAGVRACSCVSDSDCAADELCNHCACVARCVVDDDCKGGRFPKCDTASGACFDPCKNHEDCAAPTPVCDVDSGICVAECTANTDCAAPTPVCDTTAGVCVAGCTTSADCSAPTPICDLATNLCIAGCTGDGDCAAPTPVCNLGSGKCVDGCSTNVSCTDAANPNCFADGACQPACTDNLGCDGNRICETGTGLCVTPECVIDSDCGGLPKICEAGWCVDGCLTHSDCPPAERCRLFGDPQNRCEPRDCLVDADCSPPTLVCDTDGRTEPNGGGYCVGGCTVRDDCPYLGYDCNAGAGACVAHDYGDIGTVCTDAADASNCTAACHAGFGVGDGAGGRVCTGFCCDQHDCPPDFVCRPSPDGDNGAACGGACTHDVCVPKDPTRYDLRRNRSCTSSSQCRSNVCWDTICRDSCCKDSDCASGDKCATFGSGVTACIPGTRTSDLGALGCMTPAGSPSTACTSGLCYARWMQNTTCDAGSAVPCTECDAADPVGTCGVPYTDNWCGDFDSDGDRDCVYDFCTTHCCGTADCGGSTTGEPYFCGAALYSGFAGDMDICLINTNGGTAGEGQSCTVNGDCLSNLCDTTASVCRERCCTDADCGNAAYPRCQAETYNVHGWQRSVLVCVP